MRSSIFAVGVVFVLSGSALASPAMTTIATQMREAPNVKAAVVQTIPANAEIDVTGCGKIWCSASWRDLPGFVRANAISAAPGAAPLVYSDYPPPPSTIYVAPPLVVAPYGCCWGGPYWHRRW